MKKVISMCKLIIMISIVSIFYMPVQAAGRNISPNKSYEIGLGDETKTFTFTMPATGYFYYTITPTRYIVDGRLSDSTSWYLPNTRMTVSYKLYESTSVYYGKPFKSGAYSFKQGTKVTISLTDTNRAGNKGYYRLKVVTKACKNFEKEYNGAKKYATPILKDRVYTGISQQDDIDWWVFTAPETGKYSLYCVETNVGKVQVVKAYQGSKLISSVEMRSDAGWKLLFRRKVKKGEKIYILLDNGSKDEFYKLVVRKFA